MDGHPEPVVTSKTRIPGLDGMKGLAILAVIFTHLPLGMWYESVPRFAHPLLSIFLGSGGVAVHIFFIITGFLMGHLYPAPVSTLSFWSRRYARLFPPFLVMVAGFTIVRLYPDMTPMTQIRTMAYCAIGMYVLLKIYNRIRIYLPRGNWLVIIFILVQACTAAWYMFYLLHIPSAVFYEKWSRETQTVITAVINATLTLPFGQYIAQLDGIYWALCAELVFYLLYPIMYVPVIRQITTFGCKKKILTVVSVFPFCFGLYLIGQRFLGFETLKLHQTVYFMAGVFLSFHIHQWKQYTRQFQAVIRHPLWHFFWLASVLSAVLLPTYVAKEYHPVLQILMSIPVSVLLLTAVDDTTYSAKWFALPVLSILGKYSYTLFLVHSFVIHVALALLPAESAGDGIRLTAYTLAGSFLFAGVLYYLTEAPYHANRKKSSARIVQKTAETKTRRRSYAAATFGLVFGILGLLYITYKPPIALFTLSRRHGGLPPWTAFQDRYIPLGEEPTHQSFDASWDEIGMILVYIRNRTIPDIDWGFVPSVLTVRLFDQNNERIAENTYNAYEIPDSRYHPVGFPVQPGSKGLRYTVEYRLSPTSPAKSVDLVTSEAELISVYFVDKNTLIRQPKAALSWLGEKFIEPFYNPMYWVTLTYVTPFLLILLTSRRNTSVS